MTKPITVYTELSMGNTLMHLPGEEGKTLCNKLMSDLTPIEHPEHGPGTWCAQCHSLDDRHLPE